MIDQNISLKIMELRNPICDVIFKTLGYLGDKMLIWILIALILFLIYRNKTFFLSFVATSVTIGILNNLVIKQIVKRERPFVQDTNIIPLVDETSYSFPSGHSATSFAAATVLSYFYPKYRIWFYLLAGLIAFSRVYVGVHYASDVLVGALEGILVGYLISRLIATKTNFEK